MKKVALVLVLVACLVALGASGVITQAEDGSHEPMKGMKLVGIGEVGSVIQSGYNKMFVRDTRFVITNPDCANNITIEGMFIISSNGTVVYEGPLYNVVLDETVGPPHFRDLNNVIDRVEVTTLGPHEQVRIMLGLWMPDGNGGWLSHQQAVSTLFLDNYTVEISYRTKGEGLDLIGRGDTHSNIIDISIPPPNIETEAWSVPMVNMKQKGN
jgi:hypothetical protein